MTIWDELKVVLARLRDERPDALTSYPDPNWDEDRRPPFRIRLAAWAADVAGELHRQFGNDVELTVGALPFPPGSRAWQPRVPRPVPPLLDCREVTAELDGPAVVRSGKTIRHGLLLRNLTDRELQVATNGQVTAVVVDPLNGDVVGGFSGAQTMPLKLFTAAPGEWVSIPLLIGTSSHDPRLGYLIPAGNWGIWATLTLGPDPRVSPRRRTPIFPLTITPWQA